MKKIFKTMAMATAAATFTLVLAACGPKSGTTTTTAAEATTTPAATTTVTPEETTTEAPAETTTAAPEPTTTVDPEPTTTVDPEPTTTVDPEPTTTGDDEKTIVRNIKAIHTYTSFVDGKGYAKQSEEDADLYVSITQVYDYAVFYGYTMESYYNSGAGYAKYFQEFEEDGTTVKTDYFQLLKTAIGNDTYVQVTEEIKGYLKKIAALYYGAAYEDYWTYFCFIPEDTQEYQQLYDASGKAKITGYDQSDLYVSNKTVLSLAYYGYTMDQYYTWYSSYGYWTVGETDYYELLTTAMNGELYVQVTDEVKAILQGISNAYWQSEDYWTYFCSVKTEIIPEAKTETITTDYYKILEEQCGHNQFVQVNATIKEALQYLSSSFYGDAQYWDYWCYTTYDVTGETKPEATTTYTQCSAALSTQTVYINLTATNSWLYYTVDGVTTYYSLADYQTYDQTDYDTLVSLINAYWTEQGTAAEEYTPASEEMLTALKGFTNALYSDSSYYYGFTYTKTVTEPYDYTTLAGSDGEYKTVDYEDSDLYVNLDVTFDYTWNYGSYAYTMAQWYSYGGTYAGNFIKTEVVEVQE